MHRFTRGAVLATILAAAVVPGAFWYRTTFLRALSDHEIQVRLRDPHASPRDIQHALSLLAGRVGRDPDARSFAVGIVRQTEHDEPAVRAQAAWVMGGDPRCAEFHDALLNLLEDSSPRVRFNAALALSKFGERLAAPVLASMLEPMRVRAPADGRFRSAVVEGQAARVDQTLGEVFGDRRDKEQRHVIPAPVPGVVDAVLVADGTRVREGAALIRLRLPAEHVYQALLALWAVGGADELSAVRKLAGQTERWPGKVLRQAEGTAATIRARCSAKSE